MTFLTVAAGAIDGHPGDSLHLGRIGGHAAPGRDRVSAIVDHHHIARPRRLDDVPDLEILHRETALGRGDLAGGDGASDTAQTGRHGIEPEHHPVNTQIIQRIGQGGCG